MKHPSNGVRGVVVLSREQWQHLQRKGRITAASDDMIRQKYVDVAPRVLLSGKQWKVAAEAMTLLAKRQRGNQLVYTTAMEIARGLGLSLGVARVALRKLRDAGLLRHHPASGSRPEMFMPAMWP